MALTQLEQNRIIFAIDQSTTVIGFSVFQGLKLTHFGSFYPEKEDIYERIYETVVWFERAIDNIKSKDLGSLEVVFEDIALQISLGGNKYFDNANNNVFTFRVQASLLGAMISKAIEMNVPFSIEKPSYWKEKLGIKSQFKNQQKIEAQIMIEELFGEYADEDEVDAICMGYVKAKKL